jgi:ankyrin repeat protein
MCSVRSQKIHTLESNAFIGRGTSPPRSPAVRLSTRCSMRARTFTRVSASGSTPFNRACRDGDVYVVTRLEEAGSDIDARTHDSWTPAMEAVENRHQAVLDLLVEWGADLRVEDEIEVEGERLAESDAGVDRRPVGHEAAGS